MTHAETGTLRAYLDGQLDAGEVSAVEQHLQSCALCQAQQTTLRGHAALVRDGFDRLPGLSHAGDTTAAWAAFEKKREDWSDPGRNRWTWGQRLSLASGGLAVAAVVLVLTVGPMRAWA